jgi:lysophospholipase L1-like esterase
MTTASGVRRTLRRARAGVIAPLLRATQQHRRSQFAALGCPPRRVVFLGDSISEQGLWDEWFPGLPVLNRGIGGETAAQVRDRLDTAVVEPLAVFLLIGTNDLSIGVSEDEIVRDLGEILAGIQHRAPGCPVYLQSVMPRTAGMRSEIVALNRRLERLCASSARAVYVDLWPALATPDGTLRADFSGDRLHLDAEGYRAWTAHIRPLVERAAVAA